MKKSAMHVGTAGFNNGYWKGIFYPEDLPRSKWFAYYCEHFPMYEMNGSFYKFPTAKALKSWYEKAPDGFRFVVKAPRVITHYKKFNDCAGEIAEFYEVCRNGLNDKLYAVLFQLPPSFDYSPERLKMITSSLSMDFKNVIEFRHKSWWKPEVYEIMSASNLIFCSVSFPDLPEDIIKTVGSGYLRMHGRQKLFYSGYSGSELEKMRNEIFAQNFDEFTVCFNNTASEQGILNALTLGTLS